MPYDRYRRWPLSGLSPGVFATPETIKAIEAQVFDDLARASDETEKLEILDSYAAFAKRTYREDLVQEVVATALKGIGDLIEPFIRNHFPEPEPPHRARVKEKK